jgi:hypothetical protein
MRIAVLGLLTAAGLVLAALPARALDLRSEQGLLFDIMDATDGTLMNGSIDAYDGAYALTVDGVVYGAGGRPGSVVLDGRSVKTEELAIGDLRVRRFIYVPKTGGSYARYLDVVLNVGSAERTVRVQITGNLGSDSGTVAVASSSGDPWPDVSDSWFSTDDVDGSGDPSLAHVVQGPSPRVRASSVTLDVDNFGWAFEARVPAGGRIAVLTYAVQVWSQADAQAQAHWLSSRPAEALVGIESYLDDIINF